MIVTVLIGALVKSRYKWGKRCVPSRRDLVDVHPAHTDLGQGFYAFGCAAMFGVFYEIAGPARRNARKLGGDVHRVFLTCGVITLLVWLCYPIAWGVCEGGNVIAPDSEAGKILLSKGLA